VNGNAIREREVVPSNVKIRLSTVILNTLWALEPLFVGIGKKLFNKGHKPVSSAS